MHKTLISEMSWYEFRDAMAFNDLIIIPVGSNEEHGPHNPLGTDTILARELAAASASRPACPWPRRSPSAPPTTWPLSPAP